jgi:arginase
MDNEFLLNPFFLDSPAPMLDRLGAPGWIVNRPAVDRGSQPARVGAIHRPLVELVHAVAAAGRRPVAVGGDCLQTAAVLAGLRRAGIDPVVVWLDAHGDFNTPETSPSGFVGGMPLAMLVGRGEMWLRENVGLPPISERDVILSDARDLDPGEADSLADSQVAHVRAVADIPNRVPPSRPVYIHFDTDIIDAQEAPAMMYPVAGGPSVSDLQQMAHALHRRYTVVAVSMTAWDVGRDEERLTERACLSVLNALVVETAHPRVVQHEGSCTRDTTTSAPSDPSP